MNSLVFHEVGTPQEGLFAGGALEVGLSSVSSLVENQLGIPVKGFPTLPAGGEFLGHGGPRLPLGGGHSLLLKPQYKPLSQRRAGQMVTQLFSRSPFWRKELSPDPHTLEDFLSLRDNLSSSKASQLILSEAATQDSLRRCLFPGMTAGI